MTPLEIRILLDYYTRPNPENPGPEHPDAPAYPEAKERFMEIGLLGFSYKNQRHHITEFGKWYVNEVLSDAQRRIERFIGGPTNPAANVAPYPIGAISGNQKA